MHSGSQALDLLIGARSVKGVEIAYGANGRFATTCVRFRKAVETGSILFEDYSNYQMVLRFMAGAMGVPFLPTRSGIGSDIAYKWGISRSRRAADKRLAEKKLVVATDPFGSKSKLVFVPAINPDVAMIHAQKVGKDGTVRLEGMTFADIEIAKSADRLLVSCEELIDPVELRMRPESNHIPSFMVDAIVPCKYGAHPTACHRYYDYDPEHLETYRKMARDDDTFEEYLKDYVFDSETFEKYLEKIGQKRLKQISADSEYGYAPKLQRR